MSKLRKYIDIGANLTDTMYSGIYNGNKKHEPDLLQVLKRSWQSGLDKIIITGGNLEESRKALELAITSEHLYTTVGCHPTRCKEFEEHREGANSYLEKLKDIIITGGNKVVAVGECGLDYDRLNFCPKDIQLKYFNLQLSLTKTFNLPLFLHCRNAAEDLYAVLVNYPGVKGVVHSFDGSYEEACKFLDLGLYIGLNGCSLKTDQNLETVKLLPSNRILLETDCPWCEVRPSHAGYKFISKENLVMPTVKKEKWNPEQMVKSRNEPCNIRQILDIVASIRNANIDLLCEQVFDNTMELFFKKDNK
ncbi:deoxyribonuclease TATDN1 isoform X1 [Diorhabda sublineata]|uniref:deoxyribonuclease TATDN1 isoform X1 n=1 Tax=Diorhabda sublineata TaxID=1163346 RepID=UPI0024E05E6F|nr:deoxyribonuclease TATDN1 isoform X1 [Diorhabda sublineata]